MGSPRHKHQPMSEEEVVTHAYVQENMKSYKFNLLYFKQFHNYAYHIWWNFENHIDYLALLLFTRMIGLFGLIGYLYLSVTLRP